MNRRHFLIVFGLTAGFAVSALAATFEDTVVAQLKSQGYQSITVERTLLGRVKIVGQISDGRREIILNPRTGEILRDLWLVKSGGPVVPKIRDGSGHDGGDDGGEDPGDGDNSGEGNSGGGGGGNSGEGGGEDNGGDEGD